jgi:hypothetical protein
MPKPTTLLASALLAGLVFIAAPSAHAQINYQGRLTDAAGAGLVDGQYSLEFSLWDAATGGTQLWGPYVADGAAGSGHGPRAALVDSRFNVVIGAADTSSRSLTAALAGSTNTYLQIKVGTSAPISPRQVILAAPRALAADVLPNVVPNPNGVTLSGNVVVQGDAAAGTNQLVVQGKTDAAKQLLLAYNTADNFGSIQAKDAAGNTNLILNPNGGAVGIGVTAPDSALDAAGKTIKLDVNGAIKAASVNGQKPPVVITLGDKNDTVNFHAVEVPSETLRTYLGDADGGTIRFILRQANTDVVRMTDLQFSLEDPLTTKNGTTNGLQGCSQGITSNGYSVAPSYTFTIGTTARTDWMPVLHTDWLYMHNFNARGLTGIPGTNSDGFVAPNAYKAEFVAAPGIYATIIIYDR